MAIGLRVLCFFFSLSGARCTLPDEAEHDSSRSSHALVAVRRRSSGLLPKAPITRGLMVSNGALFVLTLRRPGLVSLLAKNDALLRRGQYHRLVTACFMHASVPHLVFNSASLRSLGPAVENWFGPDRFVGLYLASGLAGNALSFAVGRSPVSVGASGAIFGLLGGWYVFLQLNERYFASWGADVSDSLGSIVQTCALNAAMGMSPGARIDNMGHLGGLLGGAACSYLFGPRLHASGFSGLRPIDQPLVRLPRGPLERRRLATKRRGLARARYKR